MTKGRKTVKTSPMTQLPYRSDIDGLRAVAVLSVLIYHAGFTFLPGGFMGVDIFFVISGFLITSFIVRDSADGTFSMVAFWERRARRILPPLFVVVAATLIAGTFIFLPFDFVQLGKEMASQAAFGSNILFMMQGGYFDDGDGFKALLHTWSLAVEEQFYLFYPIGMALFARFISKKFFYLILPCALLSLALCLYMANISQRVAFYALPFRGWELLAGALVAIAPVLSGSLRHLASLVGSLLIVAALLFYHPPIAFPGWVTILPVIGTALIIWSGGSTLIGKMLSLKPMVAVGLISYSLYLWHWPILIYARYLPTIEFTPLIACVCLVTVTAFAVLTWQYVEQPIRKKQMFPTRKSIFLFSFAGLLVMALLGGIIIATKGLPQRFDADVIAYADSKQDENIHRDECNQPKLAAIQTNAICQTNSGAGKPSFIVWGDSMADAIAPVFYDLSQKTNKNGYVVTSHGCPPILDGDVLRTFRDFDCRAHNRAVMNLIVREKITKVFLIGSWRNYLQAGQVVFDPADWQDDAGRFGNNVTMAALQRTIDLLEKNGVDVFVVYNPPYTPLDPPRTLALVQRFGIQDERTSIPLIDYQDNLNLGIQLFRDLSEDETITYIDLRQGLCEDRVCPLGRNGRSFYFNPGHLSAYGARTLEPLFMPFFD